MKTHVLQAPGTKGELVKSAIGGISRKQITQGPEGFIKNLGLYQKIKRKPFKFFNDGSNIKLYFEKITSATLYRIRDLDEPGLF